MTEPEVPGYAIVSTPEVSVAEVTLGLTLYLDEPHLWAQEGAAAMLAAFLVVAPIDRLAWYTTSLVKDWHRVAQSELSALVEVLSTPWTQRRVRHHFSFRLTDNIGAPRVGFYYHEVDSTRDGRAGFLQIFLPQEHPPKDLLQLALEVGHRWPIWSGVGGYLATWHPHLKAQGWDLLYGWARRHVGLDLQDPEAGSWLAPKGLLGTNWLTLIGHRLAQAREIDLEALRAHPFSNPVTVRSVAGGAVVCAGAAPTLGDLNQLAYPKAYAEVARCLQAHLVEEPPAFWGSFQEEGNSAAWFRRFLDPEAWR